ncbi:hypothetical protein L873DRAFT_1809226 [Choiromyces venosus 120613-1]|uniref:Uncharacterized protein n=1 Tax=Choiromyces venosus 120613-1 TaxID=1336337 RepID=A0A3N4JHM9_9PEZI|nr:hypothetical protein L873DRAFT_1809226 [Choiromyces venosus 120613-1]
MILVHEVRSREPIFKELDESKQRSLVSVGDHERSFEGEETKEEKEKKEGSAWKALRRELREAYEVLMAECKCQNGSCGNQNS